jgi:hypothetical protein
VVSSHEVWPGKLGCGVAVLLGRRLEGTDSDSVMVAWAMLPGSSEDSAGNGGL